MGSRLTADQRREFRERGWFHMGVVFDVRELAEIRAEYDRLIASPLHLQETGKTPFEYSPLLHVQSPVLCRYATSRPLVEAAIDVLGPDVRLYWDQAVSKPAGAMSDVPWHQDNGYTPVVPEEYLTLTVALDATDQANGCLWIQPGSHQRGIVAHEKTDMVFYRGDAGDDSGIPVEQPEGDVLGFSSLTLHRSGPNLSPGPRRSWIIQYCHAESRHRTTGVPFDDRLLVARGGEPLEAPVREREFDLRPLIEEARREGWTE